MEDNRELRAKHVYGKLLYKVKPASQIHRKTMNYLVKWFGKSESLVNLTYQSRQ